MLEPLERLHVMEFIISSDFANSPHMPVRAALSTRIRSNAAQAGTGRVRRRV